MKKYLVEFKHLDGTVEQMEFVTDKIDWTIEQYRRNRQIANHTILESSSTERKQMLFG